MSFRRILMKARVGCLTLTAVLSVLPGAFGQECPTCYSGPGMACGPGGCQRHHCPPPYHHCQEGPPKIKFKKGCPRPVCPPGCETPNWGYYQSCWRPWPWPPDWSHCPYPVPAAAVVPPHQMGHAPVAIQGAPTGQQLHTPRRLDMQPGPGM